MLKYSRQREAIKRFLMTRTDHPTADTVYVNIKKEFPNISLGTVYRNLSLLASIGEISKISSAIAPIILIPIQSRTTIFTAVTAEVFRISIFLPIPVWIRRRRKHLTVRSTIIPFVFTASARLAWNPQII